MDRRVIWSKLAQDDRKRIFSYWNNRNKSNLYSRKLNRLFKEAIRLIIAYPYIGRSTDIENIRVKIVSDYLIIYEIKEFEIVILTIWDSHRNPDILHQIMGKNESSTTKND